MPGVLILEALAQTGAVAILSLPEFQGKIAVFGGVKNCRFKKQVVPGDVLELRFGERTVKVEVLSVAEHVGKADAPALYKELL